LVANGFSMIFNYSFVDAMLLA